MAFEKINGPVGIMREDLQSSRIIHALASIFRNPKKEPPTLEAFIPDWIKGER